MIGKETARRAGDKNLAGGGASFRVWQQKSFRAGGHRAHRSPSCLNASKRDPLLHAPRPRCPVVALMEWLTASRISEGLIFRSVRKGGKIGARLGAKSVCDTVKGNVAKLGAECRRVRRPQPTLPDQRCRPRRVDPRRGTAFIFGLTIAS